MDRVHYRYQSNSLGTESSALYKESALVPYLPSPENQPCDLDPSPRP